MTARRMRTLQDRHDGRLYLGHWATPRRRQQRAERDRLSIVFGFFGLLGLVAVLLDASGHLPHLWS
jgi:hypothetical protein